MRSWEFTSKDGRSIIVRDAEVTDARFLYNGFKSVVDEGVWLPLFSVNATVGDWISWVRQAERRREAIIVAAVDNAYAGHLILQPEEWMASQHVAKLGIIVTKEYRNIGVGRALMVCAEKKANALEYEKIILSTFRNNTVACALYESMGYRRVGVRRKHFKMPSGYIDEILMEKFMNGSTDRDEL